MAAGQEPSTRSGPLAKRRILLVEDEYLIAVDLVRSFEATGAEVVGPVASVDDALDLLDDTEHLDGAVLDINLQGEMAYAVADALTARGVPFLFASATMPAPSRPATPP